MRNANRRGSGAEERGKMDDLGLPFNGEHGVKFHLRRVSVNFSKSSSFCKTPNCRLRCYLIILIR